MSGSVSPYSERYRRVAGDFTRRVEAVPPAAWDNPAPCAGWVARDVVGHLMEWIPGFLAARDVDLGLSAFPPVTDDPAEAWARLDAALQAALDDPIVAAREIDTGRGLETVEHAIDGFCTGDVLVHTWDLARATGLDETLDPDEVHRMLAEMEPLDAALRKSGHFGPRVEVPAEADEQTRLIAFLGRQP
jgi:uncharacterized protein (TIGR03086 family)